MATDQKPPSLLYQQYVVPRGTRQTRLLHIQPAASRDAQLEATLRICKIDDPETAAAYETLSYVWGDQSSKRHSIVVDGHHTIPLTEGLASALRHLRKPDRPLRIWIDAISINQQDKDEKADQVAMMGDIYRRATHVNIWLPGPDVPASAFSLENDTSSSISLQSLFSFIASDHFHDIPGYSSDPKTGRLLFEETAEFAAAWDGFRLVADSPWWTRAWTVQEAVLPPRLRFLHGGAAPQPCDFDVMAKAMDSYWRFGKHEAPCCSEAMALFPRDKMEVLGSVLDMVGHVGHLSLRRSLVHGEERRNFDGRDCFYMIVRAFATRSCLEPRDRLYALWSQAVDECYRVHKLSYTRPLGEVYTEIFKCMIREARGHHPGPYPGIDFRVFFGPDFGPSDTDVGVGVGVDKDDAESMVGGVVGRPSWVPSFVGGWSTESVQANIRRLGGTRLFRASGWKGCKRLAFSEGDDGAELLHLDGNYADRIAAVGLPVGTDHVRSPGGCKAVFDQWRDMLKRTTNTKTKSDGRDDEEEEDLALLLCGGVYFGRLPRARRLASNAGFFLKKSVETPHWATKLCAEVGFRMMANNELWRRAERRDYYVREEFRAFWASGDFGVVEDAAYARTLATALLDRAMFVTEGGRMGLCWPHAKVGDEVWVLYGSKMPFVLRKVEGGKGEVEGEGKGGVYNMIGDCYLQGGMDGEFVRRKGTSLVIK